MDTALYDAKAKTFTVGGRALHYGQAVLKDSFISVDRLRRNKTGTAANSGATVSGAATASSSSNHSFVINFLENPRLLVHLRVMDEHAKLRHLKKDSKKQEKKDYGLVVQEVVKTQLPAALCAFEAAHGGLVLTSAAQLVLLGRLNAQIFLSEGKADDGASVVALETETEDGVELNVSSFSGASASLLTVRRSGLTAADLDLDQAIDEEEFLEVMVAARGESIVAALSTTLALDADSMCCRCARDVQPRPRCHVLGKDTRALAEFVITGSKLGFLYASNDKMGVLYVGSADSGFRDVTASLPASIANVSKVVDATVTVHQNNGVRLEERLTLAGGKTICSVRDAESLALLPQTSGAQSLASMLRVRRREQMQAQEEPAAKRTRTEISEREEALVSQSVSDKNAEAAFLQIARNVFSLSQTQLLVSLRKHVRDTATAAKLLGLLQHNLSAAQCGADEKVTESCVLRLMELVLDAAFVPIAVGLSKVVAEDESEESGDKDAHELLKVLSTLKKTLSMQIDASKDVKRLAAQLTELLSAAEAKERAAAAALAAAKKLGKGGKKVREAPAPVRMLEVYKMRM